MKNKTILFGIGGLVVGLALASFLRLSPNPNDGQMVEQSLDRHFIEQMIPHHEGAIAMANLATEKASKPEIKNLAKKIIIAQEAENKKMTAWYADWFGGYPASQNVGMMGGGMMSGSGMHMGGREEMSILAGAADFDKVFIEQMIPHHQMAIMMAQMLKAGTSRPEMLDLAEDIIESQTAEIEMMKGWYVDWY